MGVSSLQRRVVRQQKSWEPTDVGALATRGEPQTTRVDNRTHAPKPEEACSRSACTIAALECPAFATMMPIVQSMYVRPLYPLRGRLPRGPHNGRLPLTGDGSISASASAISKFVSTMPRFSPRVAEPRTTASESTGLVGPNSTPGRLRQDYQFTMAKVAQISRVRTRKGGLAPGETVSCICFYAFALAARPDDRYEMHELE